MNTIWLALVTGLTAGGISCFAVQGGLLASTLTSIPQSKKRLATALFVTTKIISYTILGALLGFFGSSFSISSKLQGWMQIIAGVYMLATAANLLEIHSIFRYVVIQPPRIFFKLIKNETQKDIIGAGVIGALTVLVPCGITQGMMILAVSSAHAFTGALILAAFTIGTSPLFFILGVAASEFMKQKAFVYVSSVLIVLLGLNSISAGNALRGSSHTFSNYWKVVVNPSQKDDGLNSVAVMDANGIQDVKILVTTHGYRSDTRTLKVNIPVRITFNSDRAAGCVQVFTIPSYSMKTLLPQNGSQTIMFTPTKTGILPYSCAMGMYTGEFQVI